MAAVTLISASRAQTWEDCPRKWWYSNVRGLATEGTEAQRRGTAVHAEIESYLKTGTWGQWTPDHANYVPSRIAQAGMERWIDEENEYQDAPLPVLRELVARDVAQVEHGFELGKAFGPLDFSGRIDLRIDSTIKAIVDHKTSSNLNAYWHLDEMGLANNTQMLVYAACGWGLDDIPATVHLSHIYYSTVLPYRVRVLSTQVSRSKIEDKVDAVKKIVELAYKAANETEPRAVEANAATCSKYGGCPHRGYCPDSSQTKKAEDLQIRERRGTEYKPMGKMFGGAAAGTAVAEKPPAQLTSQSAQIAPPDGPTPKEQITASAKLRIERIVTSTAQAPTEDFVKMILADAGILDDDLTAELVAFGADILSGATKGTGGAISPQTAATAEANAMRILEALLVPKSGSRAVAGLVRDLKLTESDIGAAVEVARAAFDDFWTLADNDDGIPTVSLDSPRDDYDLVLVRTELGLVPLEVVPPTDPVPDAPIDDRDAAIAEFNTLEQQIGVDATAAIAKTMGLTRVRKAGTEKIVGLVKELRVVYARKVAAAGTGIAVPSPVGFLALYEGVDAIPVPAVRKYLESFVPEGAAGKVVTDAELFAFLGTGADAGLWDHNTNTVFAGGKSACEVRPGDHPIGELHVHASDPKTVRDLLREAAATYTTPSYREEARDILIGIARDPSRTGLERIQAALAILGTVG